MLTVSASDLQPRPTTHPWSSVIYSPRGSELKVDPLMLAPGTATEVIKLGMALAAFLAGVLTMGTLF
ncbi:MAG TPA: hypothetical protein VGO93_29475 [Candidatus Xenobia bacterium]|jgi:hypothetical protein